jgi:PPK2 family polyphosphate:nucleotide phosphotransferase
MSAPDLARLVAAVRVTDGDGFKLKQHAPDETFGLDLDHDEAAELMQKGVERLSDLQMRLFANQRWSVLALFQAMDAAGKDGTIRHVMTGVNPQGVQVTAFKQPGPEELAHDFLHRVHRACPERGRIGIFNRSHYEEVLVCRVHPELLEAQHLPEGKRDEAFWDNRLKDIRHFERYLSRQGTVVLKFFLNVSKEEQRRRFLARIDTPSKNWKFSANDLREREHWDEYQHAYDAAIRATARPHAPWFVVPADRKWLTHLIVVEALIDALEGLKLATPELPAAERTRLEEARETLA